MKKLLVLLPLICLAVARGQNVGVHPAYYLETVGAPTQTCSATSYNGVLAISQVLNVYQCSNATGPYQWNEILTTSYPGVTSTGVGSILASGSIVAEVPVSDASCSIMMLAKNPKCPQYGAYGDSNITGTTGHDDTAAIQAALNDIKTANGGWLWLPDGYYKISGNGLNYANETYKPLRMFGTGKYTSVLVGVSGTKIMLDLGGSDNASLQDFGLEGNGADIGIFLGRYASPGTNGPGGAHNITSISVDGTYNVASVYSVASELNKWTGNIVRNYSTTAPALATSPTNYLSYTSPNGTILASTNTKTTYDTNSFLAYGNTNNAVVIYGGAPATLFLNDYVATGAAGYFITGAAGTYDLGPLTIQSGLIEATGGAVSPLGVDFDGAVRTYDVKLDAVMYNLGSAGIDVYQNTATSGGELENFTIDGGRYDAGTYEVQIDVAAYAADIRVNTGVQVGHYFSNSTLYSPTQNFLTPADVTNNTVCNWGYGITFSCSEVPTLVPITSTTIPTSGAGVCWKTPTTLGTCTAGTWPNCTTCN